MDTQVIAKHINQNYTPETKSGQSSRVVDQIICIVQYK
jgi:hypothetical protein